MQFLMLFLDFSGHYLREDYKCGHLWSGASIPEHNQKFGPLAQVSEAFRFNCYRDKD